MKFRFISIIFSLFYALSLFANDLNVSNARLNAERKINAMQYTLRAHSAYSLEDFFAMLGLELGEKDSMVVVLDGLSGKTTAKDPAKGYDMLSDLFEKGADGSYKEIEKGRNVSLDIALKDNSKYNRVILNLNISSDREEEKWYLINCSLFFISNGGCSATPFYMMFEPNPDYALTQQLDSIRVLAMKKVENNSELTATDSLLLGVANPPKEINDARKAMSESRYADAIEILEQDYIALKKYLLYNDNVKEESKLFYEDVCMLLYECYEKQGFHEKALLYIELAVGGMEGKAKKSAEEKLQKAMLNAGDFRMAEKKKQVEYDVTEKSAFEVAMKAELGIQMDELTSMMIVSDDDPKKAYVIGSSKDICKFAFIDSLFETTGYTAFISYRSKRDKAESLDKSVMVADNEVIVRFDVVPYEGNKPIVLVSYFRPIFANSEDVYPMPDYGSLNFSKDKPKIEITVDANSKSRLEDLFTAMHNAYLLGDFKLGLAAFKEKRWGDVLHHLTNAHNKISKEVIKAGKKEGLYYELQHADYMLGYTYSDLEIYKYAISYLARFYGDDKFVAAEMEYINALVNSKDVRSLSMIDAELTRLSKVKKKSDDMAQYNVFLKRRKAYMLIETGRIAEAKEYLTTLLKDDDLKTKQFAQEELEYIKKMEKE